MVDPASGTIAGPQFKLSEEQEMLVRMTRDFVADNIIPVAAEYDEKAKFPEGIFHKARELGIVNMLIPEAYGGIGATAFEEVLVSEELGYGCTGIRSSLGVNSLAVLPILIAGNEKQKANWLGKLARRKGGRSRAIRFLWRDGSQCRLQCLWNRDTRRKTRLQLPYQWQQNLYH